jgi:hypothetical protein
MKNKNYDHKIKLLIYSDKLTHQMEASLSCISINHMFLKELQSEFH